MALVDGKTYVEKAIQTTDKLAPSLNLSRAQHDAQNLQERKSNQDEESSTVYHSDEESAPVDAAYTSSESLCLSHNLVSSSSSQSRPRRAPKPAQLPCSRPSRIQNQGKRVISFPEMAALKSLSDNLSIPAAHDGPSYRAVSLPGPELENMSNWESSGSAQDNLSLSMEYLDSSLDTSYHSSGTGPVHPDSRSFPLSDMPTTPSPPSSPESVLVIGHESRVSKAFLRQCSMSSSKACDGEDEAGWITWASSPPRPIPALHGPLSLPYARCPSGAEGTIIEDADLPRMIWGLDLEDTQSKTEAPSTKSPQSDPAIVRSQASEPLYQATYDPTRNPQSLYEYPFDNKEIRRDLENTIIRTKPQHFALVPEYRPQVTREVCPDKARVWDDTPIDIHKLTPYDTCARSKPGIDSLQPKKISELTPTSPAFIPALPRQWTSPSTTPRIFIEPRPGSQITPGPRLSAIEIAQRYRAERQQNTLPSPTWSPTLDFPARPFSLDLNSSQSPYEHVPASSFDTRTTTHTRSSNFSRRDIPAETRQTEVAHRELDNIVNLPSADYSDPSFSSRKNTLASPENKTFVRPSSAIDMSLILKRLPPTARAGSRSQDIPSLQQPSALQTRTRLLQGPRIQSIPMTRLIQRRLSSVAEEDSSFATSSPRTVRFDKNDAPVKTSIVESEIQDDGLHRENKENTTDLAKDKVKKKWRPRKRNLNQNGSHKK